MNVCIGDVTFELVISSNGIPPTELFIKRNNDLSLSTIQSALNTDVRTEKEQDTLIRLKNFSGDLVIYKKDVKGKEKVAVNDDDHHDSCKTGDLKQDKANYCESQNSMEKSPLENHYKRSRGESLNIYEEKLDKKNSEETIINKRRIQANEESSSKSNKLFLHKACSNNENFDITLVTAFLNANPSQALVVDEKKRTPLHIIVQNEALLFGNSNNYVQKFVRRLIQVAPNAVTFVDDENCIPFTNVIKSWLEKFSCNKNQETINIEKAIEAVNSIPYIVEWSIKMLSEILFHSETYYSSDMRNCQENNLKWSFRSSGADHELLQHIVSMKTILQRILQIDSNSTRYRLLQYPIIQRIMLDTSLVEEDWLMTMLQNDKCSKKIIEFFEILSKLSLCNIIGAPSSASNNFREVRQHEEKEFLRRQENLFQHIANFENFIIVFSQLSESSRQRACATIAVQRILDLSMLRSDLICKSFLLLAEQVMLIISYYAHIASYTGYNQDKGGGAFAMKDFTWVMIFRICFFYITGDLFILWQLDRSTRKYLYNLVLPRRILELVMAMGISGTTIFTLVAQRLPPPFYVILTKALQWIVLFLFLQGTNLHLGFFILSLQQIMKGLSAALILLCCVCFAFTDIIHYIIKSSDMCHNVNASVDHSILGDYCSDNFGRSFLRGYAIIVGDVDLDSFRMSPYLTFFWTLFTICGVIILINVIIAVVNDSYERSFEQRHTLFVKARFPFLLEYKAYELMEQIHTRRKFHILFGCFYAIVLNFSYFLFFSSFWKSSSTWFEGGIFFFIKIFTLFTLFFTTNIAILNLLYSSLNKMNFNSSLIRRCIDSSFLVKTHSHINSLFMRLCYLVYSIRRYNDSDLLNHFDNGWINVILYRTGEKIDEAENRIRSAIHDLSLHHNAMQEPSHHVKLS